MPVATVCHPDSLCEMFIEKDSYYAVRDLKEDQGFVVVKASEIFEETIRGMVLVPGSIDDTKYVQLQVS